MACSLLRHCTQNKYLFRNLIPLLALCCYSCYRLNKGVMFTCSSLHISNYICFVMYLPVSLDRSHQNFCKSFSHVVGSCFFYITWVCINIWFKSLYVDKTLQVNGICFFCGFVKHDVILEKYCIDKQLNQKVLIDKLISGKHCWKRGKSNFSYCNYCDASINNF